VHGHLLHAQVLPHRERVVGAALTVASLATATPSRPATRPTSSCRASSGGRSR
jgi:hypothetical protein